MSSITETIQPDFEKAGEMSTDPAEVAAALASGEVSLDLLKQATKKTAHTLNIEPDTMVKTIEKVTSFTDGTSNTQPEALASLVMGLAIEHSDVFSKAQRLVEHINTSHKTDVLDLGASILLAVVFLYLIGGVVYEPIRLKLQDRKYRQDEAVLEDLGVKDKLEYIQNELLPQWAEELTAEWREDLLDLYISETFQQWYKEWHVTPSNSDREKIAEKLREIDFYFELESYDDRRSDGEILRTYPNAEIKLKFHYKTIGSISLLPSVIGDKSRVLSSIFSREFSSESEGEFNARWQKRMKDEFFGTIKKPTFRNTLKHAVARYLVGMGYVSDYLKQFIHRKT